jgi:hypothetical protein
MKHQVAKARKVSMNVQNGRIQFDVTRLYLYVYVGHRVILRNKIFIKYKVPHNFKEIPQAYFFKLSRENFYLPDHLQSHGKVLN